MHKLLSSIYASEIDSLLRFVSLLRLADNQQGLGFVVPPWNWVIDMKTLNLIGASVVSFAGGVLPLIVALMPDSDDSATVLWSGGALCKLTEAQHAGLLAWHAMANGSCAYNISDPDFSGSKTMFVC